MKKTLSLLFAIVFAAVAICTLTISAFAEPDSATQATEAATQATEAPTAEPTTEPTTVDLEDPRDTTKATEAPTADDNKTTAANVSVATTAAGTDVVTNPSGVTSIDDGDVATTKTPAPVDNDIPSTGSGIVVPAVALLALAGGIAVAVKSKKD